MTPLFPALLDPADRPALRFGADALTYRQLARRRRCTRRTSSRAGARVAVHATATIHTAVGVTAALLAGSPAVPVNPKLGERELGHVVGDCAPDLVLAAPGAALPGPLGALPRVDVDLDRRGSGADARTPAGRPGAGDLHVRHHRPAEGRGAVPRSALASNLDALAEAWDWTADDLLAHALPLFHVHGLVLGVLGPLRRGGSLHHIGALDAQALAAAGATMVFGVPTQYHRLADQLDADPQSATAIGRARLLVSGSAALTAVDHARLHRATGLAVRERYGLTETLILTAARAADEPEAGHGRPAAARHRGPARAAARRSD